MRLMRQVAVWVAAGAIGGLAGLGCAHRADEVPASASLMGEGRETSFRATEYGRVYVVDRDLDRVVYQGDVDKGEMVEVEPDRDRVRIAGRTVAETDLANNGIYRIYFEPMVKERVVKYRVVEERKTETERR